MESKLLTCMVRGCEETYPQNTKRRIRVCPKHRAADEVLTTEHREPLRFCQQCSRLHPLDRFEADQRACSRRLVMRLARRRLAGAPPPDGRQQSSVCTSTSSDYLPNVSSKDLSSSPSAIFLAEQRILDECIQQCELQPRVPSQTSTLCPLSNLRPPPASKDLKRPTPARDCSVSMAAMDGQQQIKFNRMTTAARSLPFDEYDCESRHCGGQAVAALPAAGRPISSGGAAAFLPAPSSVGLEPTPSDSRWLPVFCDIPTDITTLLDGDLV